MRLPFRFASRFVAGETLHQALPVFRELNAKGMHVAVDLLGEYVSKRAVADAARDAYAGLVETIAEERERTGLDANASIKLSMLGLKIDEQFCL
ncbi:MAG: proline dehydrogenase, partial [Rhodothermales bacterium]